jgi:acyl carrier protein
MFLEQALFAFGFQNGGGSRWSDGWAHPVLLTIIVGALLFVLLRTFFFRSRKTGEVPSVDEVLELVESLTPSSKTQIVRLQSIWSPEMPLEAFTILSILISTSIRKPLGSLTKDVILTEKLDSLEMVELTVVLEDLFKITIPDEEAEYATFGEVVRYVEQKAFQSR